MTGPASCEAAPASKELCFAVHLDSVERVAAALADGARTDCLCEVTNSFKNPLAGVTNLGPTFSLPGGDVPPLILAAQQSSAPVVKALVDSGASVAAFEGASPLVFAANRADDAVLDVLIAAGATATAADLSAIDRLEPAKKLIAAGGDAKTLDLRGELARVENWEAVVALGADLSDDTVELRDVVAAPSPAFNALVAGGWPVNTVDFFKDTALSAASGESRARVVELLDAGADANLGDPSPLCKAVLSDEPDTVAVLIERGADRTRPCTSFGETLTLAEYAKSTDSSRVARWLGKHP